MRASPIDVVADLYLEAIDRLGRTSIAVDLARAHMLYGEWLRRDRQLRDARNELRIAYEMFTAFGMEAFAERTVSSYAQRVNGFRRQRQERSTSSLHRSYTLPATPQKQVQQRDRCPALQQPSTVEYHLHKAFRKLDVKRTQLAQCKL